MIDRGITLMMLVVAMIHLLPLMGVLGVERLAALYSVDIKDPALEVLMRHRAVMFGILGGVFVYAAFAPAIQPVAFIAAFVSVGSFFWLVYSVGDPVAALRSVVIADSVAMVCLLVAVILFSIKPEKM